MFKHYCVLCNKLYFVKIILAKFTYIYRYLWETVQCYSSYSSKLLNYSKNVERIQYSHIMFLYIYFNRIEINKRTVTFHYQITHFFHDVIKIIRIYFIIII